MLTNFLCVRWLSRCSNGNTRASRWGLGLGWALLVASLTAASGFAQEQAAPLPAPPPPPYSIPWQLRPAAAVSVVRTDTAFAFYENPVTGNSGTTVATMLAAGVKVVSVANCPACGFSPVLRLGLAANSPPDGLMAPDSGTILANPLVGATYVTKLAPELRLALFLGLTLPIGGGGGDTPDPASVAARNAAGPARSAMDGAMFAVNDFGVIPGVDLAYVAHGFTAQLEASLIQLTRVRGEVMQKDSSRTNFTSGLHLGYYFIPQLSVGAELRFQSFLSTPLAVEADDALRDQWSTAIGVRAHLQLADKIWLRPGLAFARGLDDPMAASKHNILQLDIPVTF